MPRIELSEADAGRRPSAGSPRHCGDSRGRRRSVRRAARRCPDLAAKPVAYDRSRSRRAARPTSSARLGRGKMQEVWGQPVMVEYKPGAGTVSGPTPWRGQRPTATHWGWWSRRTSSIPSLRTNLPYDTLKDLVHGDAGLGSAARDRRAPVASREHHRRADRAGEEDPGTLSYATPGSGTAMHLAIELLKTSNGNQSRACAVQGRRAGATGRDRRARADPARHPLRGSRRSSTPARSR